MQSLDAFRQHKETSRGTPAPREQTLAEILKDKNSSYLFGELLREHRRDDLAARLAEGKLDQADLDILESERRDFIFRTAKAEKVEQLITKENIAEFSQRHPEFQKIITLLGAEKAAKAIRGQIKQLVMTDGPRFDAIAQSLEVYENYKGGEYARTSDAIEEMCADGKFSTQEYFDALAIKDPTEKQEALRQLSHRTYGGFKRIINSISAKGSSADIWTKNNVLANMKVGERIMEDKVAILENYQREIGQALAFSIDRSNNMRNAIAGELVTEGDHEQPRAGFSEARNEVLDDTALERAWEAFKAKHKFGKMEGYAQETAKDRFIHEQEDGYKRTKVRGFWHAVLESMFQRKLEQKKHTLK